VFGLEDLNDQRKPNGNFRRGNSNHEEHEDLSAEGFEHAAMARFAAFNISSMDMKMMSALRRIKTPVTPMVNRIAERMM